ncbi:MAG: hypothetical protein JWO84_615, partial [Parcubacteria group bacterium]|nr:hypothetical protein [Parcubacteria group bacterium]
MADGGAGFESRNSRKPGTSKKIVIEATPVMKAALAAREEEIKNALKVKKPIKLVAGKNGRMVKFTKMEVNGEVRLLEDTNANTDSQSEPYAKEPVSSKRLKAYKRKWNRSAEQEKEAIPGFMPIGVNPDSLAKAKNARETSM